MAVRALVGRRRSQAQDVALILPDFSTRIAVLDFDSFPSDPKEQAALIRFRLKRSVPFDVESAALSYFAQPAAHKRSRRGGGDGAARDRRALRSAVPRAGHESRAGDHVVAGGAGTGARGRPQRHRQAHRPRAHACWCAKRSTLKLVRCLELPSAGLGRHRRRACCPLSSTSKTISADAPSSLILCGFGAQTDEAQRRFEEELGVEVEALRSPLGAPGENNAGLLGYLRSIARNN